MRVRVRVRARVRVRVSAALQHLGELRGHVSPLYLPISPLYLPTLASWAGTLTLTQTLTLTLEHLGELRGHRQRRGGRRRGGLEGRRAGLCGGLRWVDDQPQLLAAVSAEYLRAARRLAQRREQLAEALHLELGRLGVRVGQAGLARGAQSLVELTWLGFGLGLGLGLGIGVGFGFGFGLGLHRARHDHGLKG